MFCVRATLSLYRQTLSTLTSNLMAQRIPLIQTCPLASNEPSGEIKTFNSSWKDVQFNGKVLLVFANNLMDCKLQELNSLVDLLKLKVNFSHETFSKNGAYLLTEMESRETAYELSHRSITIRHLTEVWYVAESYEDLVANINSHLNTSLKSFLATDTFSFSIRVSAFGKKLSREYISDVIDKLEVLQITGRVCLTDPDLTIQVVEDYGDDPKLAPSKPNRIYIGSLIAEGQRKLLAHYSLEKRYYIGNTSMDPEICFLMGNLAKVKPGDLVIDPFVGTGSVLISCAHLGAYVMGTDIDRCILHGWSKSTRSGQMKRFPDECLKRCMQQYGLDGLYVDLLAADAGRSIWRDEFKCDAIITDPPYGIREGAKKLKVKRKEKTDSETPPKEQYEFHQYSLADLYTDLFRFSAQHLVLAGRLVFCFPCMIGDESNLDALLSCAPSSLKYITQCSHTFGGNAIRYIVCMERIFVENELSQEPTGKLVAKKIKLSSQKADKVNTFRAKYFTPNATHNSSDN